MVTGYGLCTALGADAVQSAALARAGVDNFKGNSLYAGAGVLPHHGASEAWTDKIQWFLAKPLFEALWRAGGLERLSQRRVKSYWALPSFERAGTDVTAMKTLTPRLLALLEPLALADELSMFAQDQVAGLSALSAASQDLAQGNTEVALVIGLDSQLELKHLLKLMQQDRLKTEDNASGLMPGDACAVMILESQRAARQRKAQPHARLGAIALAGERTRFDPEAPIRAEALSQALQSIVQQNDLSGVKDVYVDLTGERWRFLEWALAETRCLATLPHGYQVSHPADCLGDPGAATGLVLSVLAMRAFARRYAGGQSVLLVTSNEALAREPWPWC